MESFFDVFISYATEDKNVADAVCHTLEGHGIGCWIAPRDVLPGAHYAGSIIKAIKNCKLMVMIYSKNSNQSDHVANEIDRMFNLGRPIIPFLIDESKMNEDYEYYLSRKHWLVAYPEYKAKCEELAETVSRILGVNLNQETKKQTNIESVSITDSYNKGKSLYYSGKYAEALENLTIAAEKGHADAQYFAGLINYLAYCGIMDFRKAAYWFEKAAEQDHVYAEEHLGRLYEEGIGTAQDYEKALFWYKKSAQHQHADAYFAIGEMYDKGKGVDIDEAVAFQHYLKAASVGSEGNASTLLAMKKVASMYELGLGVATDKHSAIKWLKKCIMSTENTSHFSKLEIEDIKSKIKELEQEIS